MDKLDRLQKSELLALEEYLLEELTECITVPTPAMSGDFLIGQSFLAKNMLARVRARIKEF